MEWQRYEYLRRRSRGIDRSAGLEGCDPRRPFSRRWRGGPLYWPAWNKKSCQGGADWCSAAADVKDRCQSRRVANRGIRWNPRRRPSRPFTVLQGPRRDVLWVQSAWFDRLAGLARLVLATGNAIWVQGCSGVHQGLLRDRLYRRTEEDRRAHADYPRRRRSDCAHS